MDDPSSSNPSTNTSLSLTSEQAQPEPPHEALFLVLAYLPVLELLAMAQVCISLRDAVKNDVLPWLNLIVQRPLSSQLNDEILLKLTSKANGKLRTLALMNCLKITDLGLQSVIEQNPFINKLYIPECTGITPEGVVRAVKMLNQGSHCLSILRINGIYNLKKEHLDIISFYLTKNLPLKEEQPIYYHKRSNFSEFKHGEETQQKMIDLEICPKCSGVRMVYDCPNGICKKISELTLAQCRGCSFCIQRCENCGGCVESEEIEESACSDVLCSECWLQLPKCSFCNKPYWNQHTNLWCSFEDGGFICRVCDERSLGYMYSSDVL